MNTEFRAHDHNEYLNADIYLTGIEVYTKILPRLGNVWTLKKENNQQMKNMLMGFVCVK